MASKRNRKSNRRLLFFIIPLVGVLIAGSIFAYYHQHHQKPTTGPAITTRPENTINYKPASPSDNAANNARKSSKTPAETLDNGSEAISNTTLAAHLVNTRVSNGNLHVGTLVTGATSGTCRLIANKNGESTLSLSSSSVVQDVNSYDCGVINVPTSKFPTSGAWKLTLTVTSSGQQSSDSTDITVPSGG